MMDKPTILEIDEIKENNDALTVSSGASLDQWTLGSVPSGPKYEAICEGMDTELPLVASSAGNSRASPLITGENKPASSGDSLDHRAAGSMHSDSENEALKRSYEYHLSQRTPGSSKWIMMMNRSRATNGMGTFKRITARFCKGGATPVSPTWWKGNVHSGSMLVAGCTGLSQKMLDSLCVTDPEEAMQGA
eukprot:gnl/MRDRNA2_/MRDRNA2_210906_c0_seq1.p1 gnl/MRDRNA2_/MRDRNA2_210906_c0~~gnl/MRDRNA2_/MRDRNA2_210906_c0_seq1.p1  ORF type:complete len:191 (-),score=25.96 gnl/MRDRNA2_/MRDRNA2_210906_c0_seq1:406-978(-)